MANLELDKVFKSEALELTSSCEKSKIIHKTSDIESSGEEVEQKFICKR